ncbi:MAG: chorismate synthase [Christensenellaceae bacterium]
MSAVFGKNIKITIFGESHSAAIGAVIDGIPAGSKIDIQRIQESMARRAPSASPASTSRKETDEFEILSGYLDGLTTGTPMSVMIKNKDMKSQDYKKTAHLMRPGHADFTGSMKYRGANDVRGGGHFSGRLTAPLVFAGSIAMQFLETHGIYVGAHIKSIADVCDSSFVRFDAQVFREMEQKELPLIDDAVGVKMIEKIKSARVDGNSVGGTIECAVCGVPVGIGEPFFDSVESMLSHMMFSIPAVKGIEFGAGFEFAQMTGSEANDEPIVRHHKIEFITNHNGGINGGISNGMPIVFRVVIKPTPSIIKMQNTVDMTTLKKCELQIQGRHDSCIVPRAVEVIKCAAAIVIADLFLEANK